jgi:hypothetical protein
MRGCALEFHIVHPCELAIESWLMDEEDAHTVAEIAKCYNLDMDEAISECTRLVGVKGLGCVLMDAYLSDDDEDDEFEFEISITPNAYIFATERQLDRLKEKLGWIWEEEE